jgi:glucose/mannose transport system permease protein
MAIRWSRWSPQLALTPAIAVTLVAFAGSIAWTIVVSLTRSRRFADFTINWDEWGRQYTRLFKDDIFQTALKNMVVLGVGSLLAIVFGFILAAMIDREKRGEGIFRTVFLYPLAVSLIVTGLAWRWLFNPPLGIQNFLQNHLGLSWAHFDWLNYPQTAMYGIILGTVWQGSGFYMALMLSGLKGINTEIWSAAKLDGVSFWRLYIEIIIPMMKFTFLTCAILLSLGVVKAYDIVFAMTNGGPGQSTWVPAYYTIDAYWQKANLGLASAAAVVMLLITVAIFLPLVLITGWQQRRLEAREK